MKEVKSAYPPPKDDIHAPGRDIAIDSQDPCMTILSASLLPNTETDARVARSVSEMREPHAKSPVLCVFA